MRGHINVKYCILYYSEYVQGAVTKYNYTTDRPQKYCDHTVKFNVRATRDSSKVKSIIRPLPPVLGNIWVNFKKRFSDSC